MCVSSMVFSDLLSGPVPVCCDQLSFGRGEEENAAGDRAS